MIGSPPPAPVGGGGPGMVPGIERNTMSTEHDANEICRGALDDVLEWHAMEEGDEKNDRAEERPLSVLFRSAWSPGREFLAGGGEAEILLGTGGPAVRIMATIDAKKGLVSPRIEAQNWGIPWTKAKTTEAEDKALAAFVQRFNVFIPGGAF